MADTGGDGATSTPLDGLRSIAEIQRRALLAANDVVSRLTSPAPGDPVFGAPSATTEHPPPGAWAEAWNPRAMQAMFGRIASLLSGFAGATPPTAAEATNAASDGSITASAVSLSPTRPGDISTGQVWIHNRLGSAVGPLRLHCGDLRSSEGDAIGAEAVSFEPGTVDDLPDLTSRGIAVSVAVPVSSNPGSYRAIVQVAGVAEIWIPIEVEVTAA